MTHTVAHQCLHAKPGDPGWTTNRRGFEEHTAPVRVLSAHPRDGGVLVTAIRCDGAHIVYFYAGPMTGAQAPIVDPPTAEDHP